jgi:hypothetical protein
LISDGSIERSSEENEQRRKRTRKGGIGERRVKRKNGEDGRGMDGGSNRASEMT